MERRQQLLRSRTRRRRGLRPQRGDECAARVARDRGARRVRRRAGSRARRRSLHDLPARARPAAGRAAHEQHSGTSRQRADYPTFDGDTEWHPLVDGEAYFAELDAILQRAQAGDTVLIAGLEVDPALDLHGRHAGDPGYTPLGAQLAHLAARGVDVRLLIAGPGAGVVDPVERPGPVPRERGARRAAAHPARRRRRCPTACRPGAARLLRCACSVRTTRRR